MCYRDNIKPCYDYRKEAISAYTSSNVPVSSTMWDRVWDNPNE